MKKTAAAIIFVAFSSFVLAEEQAVDAGTPTTEAPKTDVKPVEARSVYKWVDEKGKTHFSDKKEIGAADAEQIDAKEKNVYSANEAMTDEMRKSLAASEERRKEDARRAAQAAYNNDPTRAQPIPAAVKHKPGATESATNSDEWGNETSVTHVNDKPIVPKHKTTPADE